MVDLNSECKLNPTSAACNHWQREVCGRCPSWKSDRTQEHVSGSAGHKLMTTDECQRLKRELQASLFSESRGVNPMTYLLLLFFMVFCMALTVWLLGKAFVFKKPRSKKLITVCQDRQSGGHTSVDDIMKKLRDKCTTSTQNELYVPPRFWNSLTTTGFGRKERERQMKQPPPAETETRIGIDNDLETDTSEETSDMEESSASQVTEVHNESEENESAETSDEETMSSTSEQTERSTSEEDQTSITMDIQQEARKFNDAIGKMPTTYGPTTMNPSGNSRGKIRWANWLRRGNQKDFQAQP